MTSPIARAAAATLVGAGLGAAGVAVVVSNTSHANDLDAAPAGQQQSIQQPAQQAPGGTSAQQAQGALPPGVTPQQGAAAGAQDQSQSLPGGTTAQDPAQGQSQGTQDQSQGVPGRMAPGQGSAMGRSQGS